MEYEIIVMEISKDNKKWIWIPKFYIIPEAIILSKEEINFEEKKYTFGLFVNSINEDEKIIQTCCKRVYITLWFGRKYWTKNNHLNSCKVYSDSTNDKWVNDHHEFK